MSYLFSKIRIGENDIYCKDSEARDSVNAISERVDSINDRTEMLFSTRWFYCDANNGDDSNDGSQVAPFKSLDKALDEVFRNSDKDVRVYLSAGVYSTTRSFFNAIGLHIWNGTNTPDDYTKVTVNFTGDRTVFYNSHVNFRGVTVNIIGSAFSYFDNCHTTFQSSNIVSNYRLQFNGGGMYVHTRDEVTCRVPSLEFNQCCATLEDTTINETTNGKNYSISGNGCVIEIAGILTDNNGSPNYHLLLEGCYVSYRGGLPVLNSISRTNSILLNRSTLFMANDSYAVFSSEGNGVSSSISFIIHANYEYGA